MQRLISQGCVVLTTCLIACLSCQNVRAQSWALEEVDFESATIGQSATDLGWITRWGNGSADNWTVTSPAGTGNPSSRALNTGGADVQIITSLHLSQAIDTTKSQFQITCQLYGKQASGYTRALKVAMASANLDALTPFFGLNTNSSLPNQLFCFIGSTNSTQNITVNHWYELKLILDVDLDQPANTTASLYIRDMTNNQTDFTLATGLADIAFPLSSNCLPKHWGYWQLRGSYGGQFDRLTMIQTPLASEHLNAASIGHSATSLGWNTRWGNGSADHWDAALPAGTGNAKHAVLDVGGADVQIIKPLALSQVIDANTDMLHITCQLYGQQTSDGVTHNLRVAIASEDLVGLTPFFGMKTDTSVAGGAPDLLRFFVGNTMSTDTVTVGHWYELLLILTPQPLSPANSYASLFYRDMTLDQTHFTLAGGLAGVSMALSSQAMPANWGYWQLRGDYAGQFGELKLDMQTPTELCTGTIQTPITHQDDFLSERDLYGYHPKFIPNTISFDQDNRPHIRQGYRYWDGQTTLERHPVAIQRLGDFQDWQREDFTQAITQQYSWWDGNMHTGPFANERITFDDQGGLYTIVDTMSSNLGKALLLYKPAGGVYQVYELPANSFTELEAQDGHNTLANPPAILCTNKTTKAMSLVLPSVQGDGSLSLGSPILITADSLLVPQHSGAANSMLSVNDQVFVAWAAGTSHGNDPGTPQYITVYNRQTQQLATPVYLGSTGQSTTPDNHNIPGITIDSTGILHVVLGVHHQQFQYTHSIQPYDISSWSTPLPLGTPWDQVTGSYTYVSLLCDSNDDLHLVGRWAGGGYYFRLVYLRKKAGLAWEDHKVLMAPFRNMYSCWYHKMSMDRQGKLFVNYIYYANQLSDSEIQSYEQKWPEDNVVDPDPNAPNSWLSGVTPHDPGMLVSDDGGDTWHLGTTSDLMQ